jgi:hypothetical protein
MIALAAIILGAFIDHGLTNIAKAIRARGEV